MAGSTLSFDTPEALGPFLCRTDSNDFNVVEWPVSEAKI